MHTIDSDAQVLGTRVVWDTRQTVFPSFWLATPLAGNVTGGTRMLITDDYGNLVRIDFAALGHSLKN